MPTGYFRQYPLFLGHPLMDGTLTAIARGFETDVLTGQSIEITTS